MRFGKSSTSKRSGIFGVIDDEIDIFIEEQDLFRQLVSESILPTLTIDISDNSIGHATTEIAEWLKDTGGLWMD